MTDAANAGFAADDPWPQALDTAAQAALDAPDAEAAIRALARACHDHVGDRAAWQRPGALRDGEQPRFISGAFMVTPDARHHLLVGQVGFPPEQNRLMLPIDAGHPGSVYASGQRLLLTNTDEHGGFRQYLRSARMGSAGYAPMVWQGRFIGQFVMAAQARHTLRPIDLARLVQLGQLAASLWVAHGGPAWLQAIYPPADAFRVEKDGLSSPQPDG